MGLRLVARFPPTAADGPARELSFSRDKFTTQQGIGHSPCTPAGRTGGSAEGTVCFLLGDQRSLSREEPSGKRTEGWAVLTLGPDT